MFTKKQIMDAVLENTIVDLQSRMSKRELALLKLREAFEDAREGLAVRLEQILERSILTEAGAEEFPLVLEAMRGQSAEDYAGESDREGDTSTDRIGVIYKARHYIIARDFGEFDRKRALMLWKLQNDG